MRANEIMDLNFTVVSEKTTVREAFALMQKYGLHLFPILDRQARLLGIVSQEDILKAFFVDVRELGDQLPDLESLEDKSVETWDIPVEEIMRTDYPFATVYDPILKVGSMLISERIDVVPVVDLKRHVVGLIDRKTVVDALMSKSFLGSRARPGMRALSFKEENQRSSIKSAKTEIPERRRDTRVSTRLLAYCENAKAGQETQAYRYWPDARVCDISTGGARMEIKQPVQSGEMFYVRFNLTEENSHVECLARAIYQVKDERTGLYDTGLMFLALTTSEREKIEDYVRKGGLSVVGRV